MMTTPRLQIHLENETLYISKVVSEDEGVRLILDIDMEELKALSPSDAAYRVGGTVLNFLRVWYPEVFGEWQVPPVFPSSGKRSIGE